MHVFVSVGRNVISVYPYDLDYVVTCYVFLIA